MRTLLTGEEAQAKDPASDYYVKLEVQNASGTWKDVGALLGSHWIVNARWGEHRDSQVSSATFTLVQKIGTASLAPLMSSSVLNVDDLGAYAPLLHVGRLVRWSTATMPHGAALDVTKYRLMGSGRIDDVDETEDAEGHSTITIPCSDLGAWLMSHQIETEGVEYGNAVTPPSLESVIQAVITANTPVTEPAVTLVKQSSSSFGVTTWLQGATKLMEALITLVSDSVGEDIRYRFDASHVYQLMWFDPDRDRVTVDSTFGPEQYVVHDLKKSFADIRNKGELWYLDKVTGLPAVVTQHDSVSEGQYREQFFRLPSSKLLQSSSEAQTVIDAAVSDLSQPPAEASIEIPYCWFVQLYDRYTFQANNRQYSDDQTFAIGGYDHEIQNSRGSTVLTGTERIVGAFARWLQRIKEANPDPVAPSLSTSCDSAGQIIQNSTGDDVTVSQKILSRNDRLPTAAEVRATTAIAGQSIAGRASGAYVLPGANAYTAAFAYNASGSESPLATCVVPREGSGAAAAPTCTIEVGDSAGGRSVPVTLRFFAGAGGSSSYVYDLYRQSSSNTVPIVEASGSESVNPLSPRTTNVLKAMKNPTGLKLIVTDSVTGLSGEANDILPAVISGVEGGAAGAGYGSEDDTRSGARGGYSTPGQSYVSDPYYNSDGTEPLINPLTKRILSGMSAPSGTGMVDVETGGNRGLGGFTDNAGALVATAKDSGSRTVVRLLAKTLAGDPDTLDGTPEGSTYKRPLATRINAGRPLIDFSEAIHSNQHLGNIPDDAGSDRRAATANQKTGGDRGFGGFSNTTGGLVTTAAESGGKAVNRLFAKPLLSDPDTLDSAADGATYKKVLGVSSGLIQTASVAALAITDAKVNDVAAGKTTAGTFVSGVNESGGKALNRLLAKALFGDPDSLDGTPDGTTYKRITGVSSGLVQTASIAAAAVTDAKVSDLAAGKLTAGTFVSGVNANDGSGVEGTKGSTAKAARGAGAGKGYGAEDDTRSGARGGYPTPGNDYTTQPLYPSDGLGGPLINPVSKLITPALGLDTGYKMPVDVAVKNSGATASFLPNRHNDEQTARNTASKTFGVSFDNIPQMVSIPQSILVFKSASSGLDQRLDIRATGVSVSAYNARAVIVTGGSSAAHSDDFAATLNGTPVGAGVALSASGDAAYCDLASANTTLTTYTAKYDVDTTSMLPTNTLYVKVYTNNGTGSTSWTLVGSASYSDGLTLTGETISFDAAMALDWDVRIVISYQNPAGVLVRATVTAQETDYSVVTPGTETDATPNSSDAVLFKAMEAA